MALFTAMAQQLAELTTQMSRLVNKAEGQAEREDIRRNENERMIQREARPTREPLERSGQSQPGNPVEELRSKRVELRRNPRQEQELDQGTEDPTYVASSKCVQTSQADPLDRDRLLREAREEKESSRGGSRLMALEGSRNSPLAKEVLEVVILRDFREPKIKQYDGTKDPANHVLTFTSLMMYRQVPDEVYCMVFPSTLDGAARTWFYILQPGSIRTFDQLRTGLVCHFMSKVKCTKTKNSPMTMRQEETEPLRHYLKRLTNEALLAEDLDPRIALTALTSSLTSTLLLQSLTKRPAKTYSELLDRAYKYVNVDETTGIRGAGQNQRSRMDRKREREEPNQRDEQRKDPRRDNPWPRRREKSPLRVTKVERYTPLTKSRGAILMEIKGDMLVKWPRKMRAEGDKRNPKKYCKFHRDHGHDTEDCRHLK